MSLDVTRAVASPKASDPVRLYSVVLEAARGIRPAMTFGERECAAFDALCFTIPAGASPKSEEGLHVTVLGAKVHDPCGGSYGHDGQLCRLTGSCVA